MTARVHEELLQHPLFTGLPAEVVQLFLHHAVRREYQIGDTVLAEGSGPAEFFTLVKGSVRVFYQAGDGREVVVKLFAAPAVFGEMECLAHIHYLETVVALEKSTALVLSDGALRRVLTASPVLTRRLLDDLAYRLCIAARNERRLAFDTVEQRLAELLLSYVELYGLPVEGGIKIRVALNQEDLALAVAATRRSVNSVLGKWQKAGWIDKQGRHFIVLQREAIGRQLDQHSLGLEHQTGRAPRRQK